MELWQDGERIATTRALIPELRSGAGQETISQYADHTFYSPAGDKLVRNPTRAGYKYNNVVGIDSYYWAHYSYDLVEKTVDPAVVDRSALQKVATYKTKLPAGRYELSAPNGIGTIYIDIYPGARSTPSTPATGAGWAPLSSTTRRSSTSLQHGAAPHRVRPLQQ